jgi:hypothetical protein
MFSCILDAAARIKKCEDQLRRKTRHLLPRVAKCIEVYGWISEELSLNMYKMFVISVYKYVIMTLN